MRIIKGQALAVDCAVRNWTWPYITLDNALQILLTNRAELKGVLKLTFLGITDLEPHQAMRCEAMDTGAAS
jgi:hypothetical protein